MSAHDLPALAVLTLIGSRHRALYGVYHRGTINTPVFKLPEYCVDGF
jgi:hypothetical protein